MRLPNRPPIPQSPLSFPLKLPDLLRGEQSRKTPAGIRQSLPGGIEGFAKVLDAHFAGVVAGAEVSDGTLADAGLGASPGAEGGGGEFGAGLTTVVGGGIGVAFVIGYAGDVGEGVFGFADLLGFD